MALKALAGLEADQFASNISTLEFRARTVVEGLMQGLHQSPFIGYGAEFSSHRRYGPGDDLRHVNWKIFARQHKLYVKEFDAETNLNLYLLVDSSRSMQCKVTGSMTKFEFAGTLAAALASLALKQRDAVALALMNDGISVYVDPSSKPAQWQQLLSLLSTCEASSTTNLPKALEQAAALARHRGVVVVISDLIDDFDGIQRGLMQLRHRGHEVIVFHLLDPYERRLADSGRFRVYDLEDGTSLTTDVESLRFAYRQSIDKWCQDLENMCLQHSIDRVEVLSDSSPLSVLVNYLVRRTA